MPRGWAAVTTRAAGMAKCCLRGGICCEVPLSAPIRGDQEMAPETCRSEFVGGRGLLWGRSCGGEGAAVGKELLWGGSLLWRGSLLPLGCVAAPKSWERCALQREQAPSPQKLPCYSELPCRSEPTPHSKLPCHKKSARYSRIRPRQAAANRSSADGQSPAGIESRSPRPRAPIP